MSSSPACFTVLSTAVLRRLTFFSSIKYCIGGIEYSANDLEHGILRGNRPSPASPAVLIGRPQWAGPYFKQKDPRMQQVRHSLVLFRIGTVMHQAGAYPPCMGSFSHLGLSSIKQVRPPALAHCTWDWPESEAVEHQAGAPSVHRPPAPSKSCTGCVGPRLAASGTSHSREDKADTESCDAGGLCRKAGVQHDQATTSATAALGWSTVPAFSRTWLVLRISHGIAHAILVTAAGCEGSPGP